VQGPPLRQRLSLDSSALASSQTWTAPILQDTGEWQSHTHTQFVKGSIFLSKPWGKEVTQTQTFFAADGVEVACAEATRERAMEATTPTVIGDNLLMDGNVALGDVGVVWDAHKRPHKHKAIISLRHDR
jgi:hypothetical protein